MLLARASLEVVLTSFYLLLQPFEFAGELANWFVNWFGELAVRSVSEFALDGIPLVRCIGSVVRPWVPEPSN